MPHDRCFGLRRYCRVMLVSSERETAPVRLGSPRNQAVFGSRRKEKANPTVLPHYADPFLFILFYVNSSASSD